MTPNVLDRLFYGTLESLLRRDIARLMALAPTEETAVKEAIAVSSARADASDPIPDNAAMTRQPGERPNLPVGQPTHHAGDPSARAFTYAGRAVL